MNRRKFLTRMGAIPFIARFVDKLAPAKPALENTMLLIPADAETTAALNSGLTEEKLMEWARLVFAENSRYNSPPRTMYCTLCNQDITTKDCPCGTRQNVQDAVKQSQNEAWRHNLENRLKDMT